MKGQDIYIECANDDYDDKLLLLNVTTIEQVQIIDRVDLWKFLMFL